MTTDKDTFPKKTGGATDNDVLLEEIMKLQRAVGYIDGRRDAIWRILGVVIPLVVFILGLISYTSLTVRIDTIVRARIEEQIDASLDKVTGELMADEKFQEDLVERIEFASKDIIAQVMQATNNAEKAVLEANQAVTKAEGAAKTAEGAAETAEGAAETAEEAAETAEGAANIVGTVATQTAVEAP